MGMCNFGDLKNKNMIVQKSSRHSKITDDFAENVVLFWLSKYTRVNKF